MIFLYPDLKMVQIPIFEVIPGWQDQASPRSISPVHAPSFHMPGHGLNPPLSSVMVPWMFNCYGWWTRRGSQKIRRCWRVFLALNGSLGSFSRFVNHVWGSPTSKTWPFAACSAHEVVSTSDSYSLVCSGYICPQSGKWSSKIFTSTIIHARSIDQGVIIVY